MTQLADFAVVGDLAAVGLLFGIFHRMGAFQTALDALATRVTRIEDRNEP